MCPLVEATDNQQYKDVETRYKSLKKTFGKEVEFLHGKMKSDEKEKLFKILEKELSNY